MNQTKKRLSIINFAISITDIETIQLQVSNLSMLKTDEKIQEIIIAIEGENYAQAQRLIELYIKNPTENILQRTSQTIKAVIDEDNQAIIDEFDLFIANNANERKEEININDFLSDIPPIKVKYVESSDFDTLLNMEADDVLSNNIKIDISDHSKDTFFESNKKTDAHTSTDNNIPKDTFFDIPDTRIQNENIPSHQEITKEEPRESVSREESETVSKNDIFTHNDMLKELKPKKVKNDIFTHNDMLKELKPKKEVENKINRSLYKAIPYIAQKLTSMKNQYPAIEQTNEHFDSVKNLLNKISQEGYSEAELEETLNYIKQLSEKGEYAEAAQLLLICAATESQFSQFILARELYKGILLTKNIPESFTHMNSLAKDDYPEALCDLAQLYEHGVGIGKDKKKAEQLYKEAMEAGIQRAEKHYTRLNKQNKGFFTL